MNVDDEALYGQASRAFILRDFGRAREIVSGLSRGAEDRVDGKDGKDGVQESNPNHTRKVWIFEVTLLSSTLASSDAEQSESHRVEALQGLHQRIKQYYAREWYIHSGDQHTLPMALHPSILVALSLASISLHLPGYARQILEDYFGDLVCCPPEMAHPHSINLDASYALDQSDADLSLSGVRLPAASSSSQNNKVMPGWRKSLDRLARIYAVLVLGRAFQEWAGARDWVETQRSENVGIQVVTDDNADGLLEELISAQAAYEREQAEAELERARQAQLDKKSKQDHRQKRTSRSTAIPSSSTSPPSTSALPSTSASTNRKSPSSTSTHATEAPGFAGVRDRLSKLLPSSDSHALERSPSYASDAPSASSILSLAQTYIGKVAQSSTLSTILVLFVLFNIWRRRIGAQTYAHRKTRLKEMLVSVRDKLLETVKMGGSLGLV
ncbi:syntaxin binding protein 1 [Cystobasidiomycetes sp. EMM_F5]